jgi:alpha-ketoglutarate-dependent taurine dioxygenase
VCLEHPKTQRPLLFVTAHHVDRISDVSEARSAELLQLLFAELYAPHRRYEHVWRLGDLVIWDNLAIQHARFNTLRRRARDAARRHWLIWIPGAAAYGASARSRDHELIGQY